MDTHRPLLTRDEFLNAQHKQDALLKDEIRSVRRNVASLRLEVKRLNAYTKNGNLKNPMLPITPIPKRAEGDREMFPEDRLFPKHARQFYAMRKVSSADAHTHRAAMLIYLIDFYNVEYSGWEQDDPRDYDYEAYESSSEPELPTPQSGPKLGLEDAVLSYPGRAVEALETILGINEENFIRFRERAAALRRSLPARPAKRQQRFSDPVGREAERASPPGTPRGTPPRTSKRLARTIVGRATERPEMADRAPAKHHDVTWDEPTERMEEEYNDGASEQTRITWDASAKARKRELVARFAMASRDDAVSEGSATNAETLSRFASPS
ncbi:hypothetical protein CPLU01_15611 [Colletotrichum plurivorum]|uniref:WAC domain-containing protein n=1 Tax=Colletotrichum plurivorum TaxID=2175906 RepID=A0A8H6J976_9PEZI|nr:hypothetical protein CPLU01_15611 [Colletotrichum plurivorum]